MKKVVLGIAKCEGKDMRLLKRYIKLLEKVYFIMLPDGFKRASYLRRHNSLASIGANVYYYSRIYPADPKLLKLGDNVVIATNVRFLNHDRVDIMLSGMLGEKYGKWRDCIEIGNNVFIGADVIILPGVRVGDNTIIGAGAVVTKDLPSGYLWGGTPARIIGSFQDLINNRKEDIRPEEKPSVLWQHFYENRP